MVYVITGGPGFGKSILVDLLAQKGYKIGNEAAREIIAQQRLSGGEALPWKNIKLFEEMVASQRVAFLESIPGTTIAFSDRGLPDQIAYSWYKGKSESRFLVDAVEKYRYAPLVFITPPWKEIYSTDDIRKESFEQASEIHSFIIKAYHACRYRLIDLPFVSPAERIEFILDTINNQLD